MDPERVRNNPVLAGRPSTISRGAVSYDYAYHGIFAACKEKSASLPVLAGFSANCLELVLEPASQLSRMTH